MRVSDFKNLLCKAWSTELQSVVHAPGQKGLLETGNSARRFTFEQEEGLHKKVTVLHLDFVFNWGFPVDDEINKLNKLNSSFQIANPVSTPIR